MKCRVMSQLWGTFSTSKLTCVTMRAPIFALLLAIDSRKLSECNGGSSSM